MWKLILDPAVLQGQLVVNNWWTWVQTPMWTLNLSFSVAFSVTWYLAPSEFWCPQLCNVLWLTSFANFGIIVNTKNKILHQQLISRNYPSHAKLLACLELGQQKLIKVIKTLPKNTTCSKHFVTECAVNFVSIWYGDLLGYHH